MWGRFGLRPRPIWLLVPVLSICVVCVVAGGYWAAGNLLFMSAAKTTEGEVSSNRMQWQQGRYGRWRSYFVSVEFADNSGLRHSIESEDYYHSPMPVGSRVPVYYLPHDASTARLGGQFFWTRTYRTAAPGVAGLLFFGSLWLIIRRRTKHCT